MCMPTHMGHAGRILSSFRVVMICVWRFSVVCLDSFSALDGGSARMHFLTAIEASLLKF